MNGEVTPNAEVSPVKSSEEAIDEGVAGKSDGPTEEPDNIPSSSQADSLDGEADPNQQSRVSQSCDVAQGALGQVKAKVEVCKDESVGMAVL